MTPTEKARRLTSRDVAAHAGVSQSIVSFYFTGKRPVSKDARARIERAIEELGYRPNRIAQSLRTQRTGQVAVLIPYISNPLYAAYAAGAELALGEAGYLTLIFSNRAVPAQIDDYFDTIADSGVDGIILFPFKDDIERIERLRQQGIPIGLVDRVVPLASEGPPVDSVVVDNEGSVRAAVGHLLDLGHTKVGLITSSNETYGAPRLAGYRKAYAERGLPVPEECLKLGGGRVADGFAMTQQLLANVTDLTGLVVTMNMPTLGALEALRAGNVQVPAQISFIGFDTDDDTHHLPEPMAAIRYPAIRLGRAAANLLVERLRSGARSPAMHTMMGADLFLGSSTAPPREVSQDE
jgi:DNA-binding LacI/PurR family transcriptional regulator